MRRILRTIARALWALPLVAGPAVAQVTLPSDNTAYGTSAGEFLLLGAGARGTALGGAYAALATDVTAAYYNPAGLAQIRRPEAMISTYAYVDKTRYAWAGVAYPMSGGARSLALQIGSFGFSDQPVYTDANPEGDGTKYSVRETFAGLSYAQNFSDRFAAGLTGKIIVDNLGKTSATGFAVDFGTNFHTMAANRPLRASFVIQNLGSTLRHQGSALDETIPREPVPGQVDVPQEEQPANLKTKDWGLPVQFRVGVSLDVLSNDRARTTVLAEFNQPNNTRAGFGIGTELVLTDIGKSGFYVSGRGSWSYQSDNNLDIANAPFGTDLSGKENVDGLAAGFGVGYRRGNLGLGFDYAYRSLGVLGGTNVFGFSVSW